MRRRLLVLVAVLAATLSALVGPAGVAQAADLPSQCVPTGNCVVGIGPGLTICTQGFLCMYGDENANADHPTLMLSAPICSDVHIVCDPNGMYIPNFKPLGFNDVMSSFVNLTGRDLCWYTDANYAGAALPMPQNQLVNVTNGNLKDTASSVTTVVSGTCTPIDPTPTIVRP